MYSIFHKGWESNPGKTCVCFFFFCRTLTSFETRARSLIHIPHSCMTQDILTMALVGSSAPWYLFLYEVNCSLTDTNVPALTIIRSHHPQLVRKKSLIVKWIGSQLFTHRYHSISMTSVRKLQSYLIDMEPICKAPLRTKANQNFKSPKLHPTQLQTQRRNSRSLPHGNLLCHL